MRLAQLLISGVITGSVYAVVAIGLIVVYRASSVLNFAHGQVAALAAFFSYMLFVEHGLPMAAVVVLALAVTTTAGVVIEGVVIRPLRKERPLNLVVATLGVGLIIEGIADEVWGQAVHVAPAVVSGPAFRVAGITVSRAQLVMVVGAAIIVVAVGLFFRYVRFGLSMRAVGENATVASLLGVSQRAVSVASWAMGGLLGGAAALLIGPEVPLTPDALTSVMIQGFSALVIAGFTSVGGAIVGGLLAGIGLNLFAGYVTPALPNVFLLVLLLVVLLVRPSGLFGKREDVRL